MQRSFGIDIRNFADRLSLINMYAMQKDVFAKVQEGTGVSLLTSSIFQSWCHGETQTLLCTGLPGTGKTVFASQVIELLSGHDYPVLYFFADIRTQRTEQQTLASILANLLKQLIIHNGHVSDETRTFCERHIERGYSLPAEGTLSCLEHEIARSSKSVVVIDALDELFDSCRKGLLQCLRRLQQHRSISIMATSRRDPQNNRLFTEMLPGYRTLDIHQAQEDIEAFILGQMPRLPSFLMESMELQHYVRTEIMNRSDGVYV